MVKTYNEYLKLLERAVVSNGKKELSDYQIEQFIKTNNLDSDWNIVAFEVKKDMMPIVKRLERLKVQPENKPVTRTPNSTRQDKKVKGYTEYLNLLESAILQNGKKELSQSQLEKFIRVNDLYKDWGIVSTEVSKDMETILVKFARQERAARLKLKYGENPSALREYKNNLKEKVNSHRNERRQSGLTEEDKNITLLLRDMLKNYPDVLENKARLKSAIADILPGKKKEVNLLGTLAEENITVAIKNENSLDQILCDRFALILEDEYGTSVELARRMVLIWFHAYGRMILNKNID